MRISGLCYARLLDHTGRYALLINEGRLQRGERIMSPIGGGFEFYPQGRKFIESLGGTNFEDNDVRFYVPDEALSQVVTWFRKRLPEHRELLPSRELREELCLETGILSPEELQGFAVGLRGFARFNSRAKHPVAGKPATAYLIEIFDVTLPQPAMRAMSAAATLPVTERWVYFVTKDEINAGVSRAGVAIDAISRTIL